MAGFGLFVVLTSTILTTPHARRRAGVSRGSRIGLVPPAGMTLAQTFPGFIDAAKNAGILIGMLPLAAYPDIEKTLADDALKKQGFAAEKRETLQLGIGKGLLVVGTRSGPRQDQVSQVAADRVDRRSHRAGHRAGAGGETTPIRTPSCAPRWRPLRYARTCPMPSFSACLPFTVGDFAGFSIGNVIPGRALMLIDAPGSASGRDPGPARI